MEKFKEFMYNGWIGKPAYIRAFGWLLLGVVIGIVLK